MRIPKMCLKLSFSHSKWVWQAILSLTVFSNCVSDNWNFDTVFLPDCTKFYSIFSCYWIGNLMRIPKMSLKQSFSHSKWVWQVILSLTLLSNCVSDNSNFDTVFLPDCTKFGSVFSVYWIWNLMRIPKMCLKQSFSHYKWVWQVILFLTVFSNCVSDSSNFDTVFLSGCTKFCSVFSRYWIENLLRIPKMFLKQSFSHSKWVWQVILSLTVFSNYFSGNSNFDTMFPSDCTKFYSIFSGYWIGNLMKIPKMCLKLSKS